MRPITLASLVFAAGLAAPALAPPAAQAQTVPPLTYVQQLPPQAVQAVQQRLSQAGFYQGRLDGVWGPDSEAALERFQASHALQVTGQLNEATARNLGLTRIRSWPPHSPRPATMAASPGTLSPDAVRAIQGRLRYLGFYNGNLDGVWGGETQAAYSRYQARNGLQVTGMPNAPTLQSLGLNPEMVMAGR